MSTSCSGELKMARLKPLSNFVTNKGKKINSKSVHNAAVCIRGHCFWALLKLLAHLFWDDNEVSNCNKNCFSDTITRYLEINFVFGFVFSNNTHSD